MFSCIPAYRVLPLINGSCSYNVRSFSYVSLQMVHERPLQKLPWQSNSSPNCAKLVQTTSIIMALDTQVTVDVIGFINHYQPTNITGGYRRGPYSHHNLAIPNPIRSPFSAVKSPCSNGLTWPASEGLWFPVPKKGCYWVSMDKPINGRGM